jgi:hypothetical protein
VEAREKLDTAAAQAGSVARVKMSRAEMKEEIEKARTEEGFSVGLAARKGGTDEASDEELEELLVHIEMLRGAKGGPVD